MKNNCLYLIGSLRNKRIPELAKKIRNENPDFEVFDDWFAAGPEADDCWKEYEKSRGSSYQEALRGHAAKNVFQFDKRNLDRSSHVLLVLPAGKSGHMEIMYGCYGVGASSAILLDETDVRWDVMYQFIPTILNNDEEISEWLNSQQPNTTPKSPVSNSLADRLSKERLRYWASEPKSMLPTTGEEDLSGPGLSEQQCGISKRSTTAKTSTLKAH